MQKKWLWNEDPFIYHTNWQPSSSLQWSPSTEVKLAMGEIYDTLSHLTTAHPTHFRPFLGTSVRRTLSLFYLISTNMLHVQQEGKTHWTIFTQTSKMLTLQPLYPTWQLRPLNCPAEACIQAEGEARATSIVGNQSVATGSHSIFTGLLWMHSVEHLLRTLQHLGTGIDI